MILIVFLFAVLGEVRSVYITDSLSLGTFGDTHAHCHVYYDNGYVYFGGDKAYIADVSDPSNVVLTGTFGGSCSNSFVTDGTYGYCGNFRVLDISDKSNPFEIGYVGTADTTYQIAFDGDYAVIASHYAGLNVVNITTKDSPFLEVTQSIGSSAACGIGIEGDYAYADYGEGFKVVDISNKLAPSVVGSSNDGGTEFGVYVEGNYAYVAAHVGGLHIYDVSVPDTPVKLSSYITPDRAFGVAVVDDIAYVADWDGGLILLNVSDKENPSFIEQCASAGTPSHVVVDGKYAYVVSVGVGLEVFNIECRHPWVGELCDQTPCELTCDSGNCVGPETEFCTCDSGYEGTECDQMTTCGDWKDADPLATDWVPLLMETSEVAANNIIINFDYRVKIGDVEDNVCDSWTGPTNGWSQAVENCTVKDDGVLSWDDVESLCSWDTTSSTDDEYIYKNTIYFNVMEDFDLIDRSLEFDYDIEVRIPRTVLVDTIDIDVLSPVTLLAVLFEQDVSPKTLNGVFGLLTRVDYPYILSFDQVTAEPTDITSGVSLTDQTCLVGSGDCDQEWTNAYTISNSPPKCDVSGTYTYRFLLNCRAGYPSCPYEDEIVEITTTIVSENFCDELQFQTDISATMESCEDEFCSTTENGFITTETAFFEVTVVSEELTLHESDIVSVWLTGASSVNLFLNGGLTGDGISADFQKTAGIAPRFQFDLGNLPANGLYTVNAKVSVTYDFETTRRTSVVEKVYSLNVQNEITLVETDDDLEEDSFVGWNNNFLLF